MCAEVVYMLGVIGAGFAVNYLLRALPFLLFAGKGRELPRWVERLGAFISPVIIAGLIVYSYSGLEWRTLWPYLVGAVVVGLQLWKRNPLVSIVVGTMLYMGCVQLTSRTPVQGTLEVQNWCAKTRSGLEDLIARHRGEKNAYAVFDCDNTLAIGDVSQAYQINMLEDLHFAFGPDELAQIFLKDVPDVDRPLVAGNPRSTAKNLAHDLADAYRELLELKRTGADFRATPDLPVFAEFAAKYQALYHGLIDTFGTEMAYPWIGYALVGQTREEIAEYERLACRREIARGCITRQRFVVPASQARRAGVFAASYVRGLAFPPENVALLAALRQAGIVPHVVSASNRELLLAVFASKEFGFDLPASCVFGYTFRRDAAGRMLPEHSDERRMPQAQGKVDLIRRELMPRFGGREPVLVGGDSMGDYAMLTAFSGMDRGLVYNHRGLTDDPLSDLVRKSLADPDPRYLLQGRDNATASLVPARTSATVSDRN